MPHTIVDVGSDCCAFFNNRRHKIPECFFYMRTRSEIISEYGRRPDKNIVPNGYIIPNGDIVFNGHAVAKRYMALNIAIFPDVAVFTDDSTGHDVGIAPYARAGANGIRLNQGILVNKRFFRHMHTLSLYGVKSALMQAVQKCTDARRAKLGGKRRTFRTPQ